MHEMPTKEEFDAELGKGNYVRAALLADALALTKDQRREVYGKALWEMAAVSRNALGTKQLAREFGFSKESLQEFLEDYEKKIKEQGDSKPLKPRYDFRTDKYLTFEQWTEQLFKTWVKLSK